MYTKLEEMLVDEKLFSKYAEEKGKEYESRILRLRDELSKFPTDISEISDNSEIGVLQFEIGALSGVQLDYRNALNIIQKIRNMIQSYKQIYEQGQLDSSISVDDVMKDINKQYSELKEKNFGYKKIIGEISFSLYTSHDIHIKGLGDDLSDKLKLLQEEYSQGLISKEQLIYYEKMCNSLIENPNYHIMEKEKSYNSQQSI